MSTGTSPESYYVYHNWQAGPSKAVIHRGSCGYCKDGHGRAGGYDPAHARWSKSFPTLADAHNFADQLNTEVAPRECRCI